MKLTNKKEEHIGVVGVDSGQLIICDPCYIDSEWKRNAADTNFTEHAGEFSYTGCGNATLNKKQAGQLFYQLGHAGAGVAFSSGLGDGTYDVYATYADVEDWGRRIVSVRVDFVHPLLMKD